jgi:hypothetical protein
MMTRGMASILPEMIEVKVWEGREGNQTNNNAKQEGRKVLLRRRRVVPGKE